MKPLFLNNCLRIAFFSLIMLPQLVRGQSKVLYAETPLHLQLENTYCMAGDKVDFLLQTADGRDAWYLLQLFEQTDTSQAAAIYGKLRHGSAAGSMSLPEQLKEGVYWFRAQVEGMKSESFTPVYVFGRPREIEPEAQPPFQLRTSTRQPHLFAGKSNELLYELWPRPLMPDGRLIVQNQQGAILVDTLLEKSGKGIVALSPAYGDVLRMEVWLDEKRVVSSLLPEVVAVAPKWQLTENAFEFQVNLYEGIGAMKLFIEGPDGFRVEEAVASGELFSLNYAAWPSGHYTIRLMDDGDQLLLDHFSLRTKAPALHLQQQEIPMNKQALVHARIDGLENMGNARRQLRVYSASQQLPLFEEEMGYAAKVNNSGLPGGEPSLSTVEQGAGTNLNPQTLQGIVKDPEGNPVAKAMVTLSGRGLGRIFYTVSDESGGFTFDNLPLTGEVRYLAAFNRDGRAFLRPEVVFPTAPVSFPAVNVDSVSLLQARSYAQKHYLLRLLQNEGEEKEDQTLALKTIELEVPQEWISSFKPADYVDFPALAGFIQEVIPGLRVRYKDGESYLQVLNIVNGQKIYYKGEPLYLLNGYPVSSADSLLSLDMAVIDRVQLVRNNSSFYYGRIAQFGIVAVYTKEEAVPVHLPQEGMWLPAIHQSGEATDFSAAREGGNSGLPDFRKLIRWTSISKVQPDGSFSFVLEPSDEVGEFMVELTFYYENHKLVKVSSPLEVVRPAVP